MRWVLASAVAASLLLGGLWSATQVVGRAFSAQAALGRPLVQLSNGVALYPPWSILVWDRRWSDEFPKPFAAARLILLASAALAAASASLALKRPFKLKPIASHAWASRMDAGRAGLFAAEGAVLGRFEGQTLVYDGAGHQLLIGASRSGKGRGQVVPTLLATSHSMLVLDVKGELADGDARHDFPGTAGFRERLGPVLRFAPTSSDSAAFNPLFEVRKGPNEVRDVQNLIEVLFAAHEDRQGKDFWNRSAANIAAPVALHVLYSEPPERKTLAVVREKLRDLTRTANEMARTLHRLNPHTNRPEVHPEILHGAQSFLSGEERMRSGIQATVESMFGLFADPIVAQTTSRSDFRLGDLMSHERPVTLYLQPPPGDVPRLMPLLRTIVDLSGRMLMESQTHDAMGRPKRHRLVMLLDEFPLLGRLSFFETMMGAMAGYGLRAFLVCQSLNHLTRAYGRDNVILDNCQLVTAFAAADSETARRIADMAGEIWEVGESETERRPKPLLGFSHGSRSYRRERRALLLPGEVRALDSDEALIFMAGMRPLRATKLRFDSEPVFRERLCPSSKAPERLTTQHDWDEVRALGYLPAEEHAPKSRRGTAPQAQGELFGARETPAQPKTSDLALAAFRGPDGRRLKPAGEKPQDHKPRSMGI